MAFYIKPVCAVANYCIIGVIVLSSNKDTFYLYNIYALKYYNKRYEN
jgi:hypothetical protein